MTRARPFLLFALIALLIAAAFAQDQAGDRQQLTPNETQRLRLENALLRAQLAQQAFNRAQNELNGAVGAIFSTCDAIKKENKWPDAATCEPTNSGVIFYAPQPAKPQPSKEEKKEPPPAPPAKQ